MSAPPSAPQTAAGRGAEKGRVVPRPLPRACPPPTAQGAETKRGRRPPSTAPSVPTGCRSPAAATALPPPGSPVHRRLLYLNRRDRTAAAEPEAQSTRLRPFARAHQGGTHDVLSPGGSSRLLRAPRGCPRLAPAPAGSELRLRSSAHLQPAVMITLSGHPGRRWAQTSSPLAMWKKIPNQTRETPSSYSDTKENSGLSPSSQRW